MNQRTMPVPGEFYRHFKNRMYQIVAVAVHSETGEKMVVYQALYGEFKVWVRPLTMFMEEVDHTKYPKAGQKYRFEKVDMAKEGTVQNGQTGPGVFENTAVQGEADIGAPGPMNQNLLDFFDAMDVKNYDKMLEALAKLSGRATQKEVDDICMVLDIQPSGKAVYDQIADIRRHVLMLKKFDGERLR